MMLVKQISVFVENKKGRLADITRILTEHNIDISAISIADTTNFGILRMIVNNPEDAVSAIHKSGYTANTTEVIAVEVPDHPGGLHHVLDILDQDDISIEYLYSFIRTKSDIALILLKVEHPKQAIDCLTSSNIKVLKQDEVYGL